MYSSLYIFYEYTYLFRFSENPFVSLKSPFTRIFRLIGLLIFTKHTRFVHMLLLCLLKNHFSFKTVVVFTQKQFFI